MAINYSMKVLVVDDFATMRRIIKNILRQIGFTNIVEADDGTTAWETPEQRRQHSVHRFRLEHASNDRHRTAAQSKGQ